jgi:hypothetical protein
LGQKHALAALRDQVSTPVVKRHSREHHLIVAHEVVNVGNDRAQLADMSKKAKVVLARQNRPHAGNSENRPTAARNRCSDANPARTKERRVSTQPRPKDQRQAGEEHQHCAGIDQAAHHVEPNPPRPRGKLETVLSAIEADSGATLEELVAATSWQPHTTRAAITRLRQRGFDIRLADHDGRRAYRLAA